MDANALALDHLAAWTIAAHQLPPGAALLEPVDSSTTWWAICDPRTGAVFGWHADPHRLLALYWQALSEEDRLDLVAEAAAAMKEREHFFKWKAAWSHWTIATDGTHRAASHAVAAWLNLKPAAVKALDVELSDALSRLAGVLFPDDAEEAPAPPADAGGRDAVALGLATAALVQGDVELGRLIHYYGEVARRDPGKLSALLSGAQAAVEFIDIEEDDQPAGRC